MTLTTQNLSSVSDLFWDFDIPENPTLKGLHKFIRVLGGSVNRRDYIQGGGYKPYRML